MTSPDGYASTWLCARQGGGRSGRRITNHSEKLARSVGPFSRQAITQRAQTAPDKKLCWPVARLRISIRINVSGKDQSCRRCALCCSRAAADIFRGHTLSARVKTSPVPTFNRTHPDWLVSKTRRRFHQLCKRIPKQGNRREPLKSPPAARGDPWTAYSNQGRCPCNPDGVAHGSGARGGEATPHTLTETGGHCAPSSRIRLRRSCGRGTHLRRGPRHST